MGSSDQVHDAYVVAVDAMGGDYAPVEVVAGAVQAARQHGVKILLVGDQPAVERELARHQTEGLAITLVPSKGIIQESEHPLQAMREKPQASVVEAVKLVKSGRAQAMVSMGSTGAAMATATLVLGLLKGVERPAIGGPLLGQFSPTVLVDLGSNLDCRPSQLLGFAAIGVAFARTIQGIENPRVALLSVGAEEGKGNRQIQEAFPILQESGLNFVGNVEGGDFFLDKADVVVCDGFIGNILMKFGEGLSQTLAQQISRLMEGRLPAQELRRMVQEVYALTNTVERLGGGPLLGVDGVAIVGHGRSKASTVADAIGMARRALDMGLVESMRQELAKVYAGLGESIGRT